ncbi:DUF2938 family protein [Aestuariibacter sp. A3R04]|uniref:DUF2938 family protein n=1 Tax=Aestuariibacter sp. A3R04 TaxID=2841571 RepID=UPI001C0A0E4B|nr:DUF2938 family protein [Aestuariibacter sp. A3R04]MBU3021698.1 DUF2938 domain-containing protein [Aestuariibacter sp. A3R04]
MQLPIYLADSIQLGLLATLWMDILSFISARFTAIPFPNYPMVGRWFGYVFRGTILQRHTPSAPAIQGEKAIGWAAHYLVGICFSLGFTAFSDGTWLTAPTLLPALATGMGTVILPYFIMQPCMGLGVAAAKTPQPGKARLLSLYNHTLYGVGLFLAGESLHLMG